jgi:hypothetical protein
VNRDDAIDAVREIMYNARADELVRLDAINSAMKPWTYEQSTAMLEAQGRRDEPVIGMKWRSQTNFLPLVVDVYSQAMKLDNYLASDTKDTAKIPWEWWQRNKMDARQTGLVRGALKYGVSYATVLPSLTPGSEGGGPGAFIRCLSPRQMTCLYGEPVEWTPGEGPVDDDWPMLALEIKDKAIRLYDEKYVYFIGVKQVPQSALGWRDPLLQAIDNFEYIERREHGVGVCPVVRFRDRWHLDGEEQYGIVEPLLSIQSRINETEYNKGAAEYFTAFAERWVAGWRPQSEEQALTLAAGDVWYFSSKDVKVGQFAPGDIKAYLDSGNLSRMDLASVAQLPPHNLGLSQLVNISEATLAALETGKRRNTNEIQTSLGESFEQMLRACSHIVGDTKGAEDFASEAKWADLTARTLAETIDALGKMASMLDIPEDILYEDIPGKTKAWVDRVIKLRDELREKAQQEMEAQMRQAETPPEEDEDQPPDMPRPPAPPRPVPAALNGQRE